MNRHVCTFNSDRRYWFELERISITKGFKEALGINLLRSQRAEFPVWYSELMDDVYFSRLLLALDAEWMKIDFHKCRKVSRAYRRWFSVLIAFVRTPASENMKFRGIWIMHSVNALRKASKNQTTEQRENFVSCSCIFHVVWIALFSTATLENRSTLCTHEKKENLMKFTSAISLELRQKFKTKWKKLFLGSQRITLNEASLSSNEHLSGVEKLMEEKNYLQCNPFMTFPRKLFMFCRKEIWKSEP